MTRFAAPLLLILTLMGCAAAIKKSGFYPEQPPNQSYTISQCQPNPIEGRSIKIIHQGSSFTVAIGNINGPEWGGILFLPFIPLRFSEGVVSSIFIEVQGDSQKLSTDFCKWKLFVNEKAPLFPEKNSKGECHQQSKIEFKIPVVPINSLALEMDGILNNQQIRFQRQAQWRYYPVLLMPGQLASHFPIYCERN